MKIICLNTWGGKADRNKLLAFFEKYSDCDIFCLQEIWNGGEHMKGVVAGGREIGGQAFDLLNAIQVGLGEYQSFFCPHFSDHYGLALFSKKEIRIHEEGDVFVHKYKGFIPEGDAGHHARNIQYIKTKINGKPLTVINFHGLWNGQGKTDTEDRINQSKNILEFCKSIEGEYILCGDFNLRPDTESIALFEKAGLKNLIKEYGITSTRTSYYDKPERFADYAFVTKGVKIKEFKVLPDEVSDHAALYLEIDL